MVEFLRKKISKTADVLYFQIRLDNVFGSICGAPMHMDEL